MKLDGTTELVRENQPDMLGPEMKQLPRRKPKEVARKTGTYRFWLRNNALKWHGVEPDHKVEHPPLTKKVSARGETHYVEIW